MTPTQRSIAHLKKDGWLVAIVEKWNPYCRIRQDLFGMFDLLAIRGNEVLGVQTTSGSHVSDRLDKIRSNPNCAVWLASPTRRIEVHGWRKVGAKGKRKTWQVRVESVEPFGNTEQLATPPATPHADMPMGGNWGGVD